MLFATEIFHLREQWQGPYGGIRYSYSVYFR